MRRRNLFGYGAIAVVVALATAVPTFSQTSRTQLNLQGRLTDKDGKPLSGTHRIDLRVFDHPTEGPAQGRMPLFQETQPNVPVTDGIYNILIGSKTTGGIAGTLFDRQDLYLEIEVDLDNPLDPRTPIVATPYAFSALRFDGKTIADFLAASGQRNATNLTTLTNGSDASALHGHPTGGRNFDWARGSGNPGNFNGDTEGHFGGERKLTITNGNPVWLHFETPGHMTSQWVRRDWHPQRDGSNLNLCQHYRSHHHAAHHLQWLCDTIITGLSDGQHTFDTRTHHHDHHSNVHMDSAGPFARTIFVEELIR